MTERLQVIQTRWTPADRRAGLHHLVDIEVPFGTPTLAVDIEYDRAAATIDLGVFDPGGFRGYSGGARTGFVVAATGATPGYLPGAITPGTWQVQLGLYELPDRELEVIVTVDLGGRRPPAPPPLPALDPTQPSRQLPAPAGQRWVPGDLHSHTTHSDGTLTPPELVAVARERGLGFLAISDHNTVSHHRDLARLARWSGLVLVPAQEVTSTSGHANCFGDVGWVDFRDPAQRWLDHARTAGGLLSLNHPLVPRMGWNWELSGQPDLVEAWHWTWDRRSSAPLDWWATTEAVPVGGSDFHDPAGPTPLGNPTTWVQVADDTTPGDAGVGEIMAALAAGRTAISAAPDAPVLLRIEDELVAVDADGTTLVSPDGSRTSVAGDRARLGSRPGLHRLTATDGTTLALST